MSDTSFMVEVDGQEPLHGLVLEGHEQVNAAFAYHITVAHEEPLDLEALIGAPASVKIPSGRTIRGVVTRAVAHDTGHTITLEHASSRLEHTRDYRVFVDDDVTAMAQAIVADHGLELDCQLAESPAPRAQCVQQFESDFDFLRRILADEGALILADPTVDKLIATDHTGAYEDIEGDPALRYGAGEHAGMLGPESVHGVRLAHAMVANKATRRDRDPIKPQADLTAATAEGAGQLECYEYPGVALDGPIGERRAKVRLAQLGRHRLVLTATSSCRRLAAGKVFELTDAPRAELNQRWLITQVDVRASVDAAATAEKEDRFVSTLEAVPAATPYCPNVERRPRALGVQHAIVTGAKGSEIHTEEHGRSKVKLRWDRRRESDDTSSAWARVVQPAMSGGMFMPRMGWENLIGFGQSSQDAPIMLGRLDNGASPPAEALPGKKVRSALGTPTTPGGGSFNGIMFDDSAGGLGMNVTASADLNEKTESAKKTSVAASDTLTVGGTLTESFKASASVKIDGAQVQTVSATRALSSAAGIVEDAGSEAIVCGSRNLTIGGDLSTQAGGTLSRTVGAAKMELALGGYEQHVSAASALGVGGAWLEAGATAQLTVGGANLLTSASFSVLAAAYSEKALGIQETSVSAGVRAAVILYKAPAMNLSWGGTRLQSPTVIFKGSASIGLNAGGARLWITPGSVKVSGVVNAAGGSRGKGTVKHG